MNIIQPHRNGDSGFLVSPALCIDLDGTIRKSKTGRHIEKPEDIVLLPNVEATLWNYKNQGYYICGCTNQGGVAHGFKTPADNVAELEYMSSLFQRNPIDFITFAYHMDDGKIFPYNMRSLLRKPDYGMLVQCEVFAWQKGIVIDWEKSLFVGDRPEDKGCADAARIRFQWAKVFFKWDAER